MFPGPEDPTKMTIADQFGPLAAGDPNERVVASWHEGARTTADRHSDTAYPQGLPALLFTAATHDW